MEERELEREEREWIGGDELKRKKLVKSYSISPQKRLEI